MRSILLVVLLSSCSASPETVGSDTETGVLENEGRFELTGTGLDFIWAEASASALVELRGNELVLTSERGDRRRYVRVGGDC